MKFNIQIREARTEDNEEVTAFAFEIMRSVGIEPDPENIDSALVAFGKKHETLSRDFVAVDGERPIGSVILKMINSFVGEVTGFYVKTDYQNKGIGRKLMNTVLSAALEAGYKQVVLTTNKNLTAAINLYESLGWVRQPEKPNNGADYLYSLSLRKSV